MTTNHPAALGLIRDNLTIPTLPEVVLRINQLVDDPDTGCREIGELVAGDPPLTAKVLRIANSAYYGLSGECVSPEHASTVLGMRVLRNIVTQIAVISQFEHLEQESFSLQELWTHAIHTGHVAAHLGKLSTRPNELAPDELYVCGLLHDVGKVVMVDGLGAAYPTLVQQARENGEPLHVAERREYGFDHATVGSIVSNRWGLPEGLQTAIGHHHGSDAELSESPATAIVSAADWISHCVRDHDEASAEPPIDEDRMASIGVPATALEELLEYAREMRNVQL